MELSTYYPVSYSKKMYRKKQLSPQQIKFCEAFVANEYPSVAAKIAGYKSPARASAYLLKCKRITDYIAVLIGNKVDVPVTFEKKAKVLSDLMDTAITDNIDNFKSGLENNINIQLVDRGLEAIKELNKMQGHYAPTQSQSVQVTVKETADKLREARKQYDEY